MQVTGHVIPISVDVLAFKKVNLYKLFFMAAQSLENDFVKYWSMLTDVEKESLLTVAKNYAHLKQETRNIDIKQYNIEIDEAVARVEGGEYL